MLLKKLLEAVNIQAAGGNHDVRLKGITYDSRKVCPGFLFVSIKGFKSDGHDYVGQAVKQGAVAVVMERKVELPPDIAWAVVQDTRHALAVLSARFYGDPAKELKMIGVTGTNGKTTTASLISAILGLSGAKVGLIGTIHNRIGTQVIPGNNTTPESTDLQALLRRMVREGVGACVMEVSSHALALNRVDGCEFDMAVFTNLTQDHLDFHQSMGQYLEEKLKLFKNLKVPGDKSTIKHAVINADDPAAERFAQAAGGLVHTFGIKNTADVYATNVNINTRGVNFQIDGKLGRCQLNLCLTGLFNVYNALGAFTAAAALGVPHEIIKSALENIQGIPGRFEKVDAGQDFTVIVDYAHTPDGLENILKTARQLTQGRLITVYGCGGDRDRGKRPVMGSITAKYSDFQIITADNPRTESPAKIIQDIIEGVRPLAPKENYLVEQDRRKAIGLAISMARKGDVVIIAGKGHEDYQIIGTEKFPFEDRREAASAIKNYLELRNG
ncbi:UDP-N-acetylmuramoyl-L-alanyl-D-glutamate--2,6-diaminopimelate ligase [Pelotomaculum terephthalicicum JT]|uniref:UDP-N-acetylmuramoyl-L-alanyl-D-glutamate--2, 6-diaminopimelate ligase n=1 Tax=Pelotomaculum TaxID=191373 RepID=UPI0009D29385|nr:MULTISPECIES: UDP-N-acetylmuramoyl-L-alanyl-D-glutamate--2,6-diaminopimelate ligase [Pelotomaculum]MCG9968084.1 UDP-N-acetylmuramoyl-L-alanyl-D-glutamate--2,6-diaminopimelate ligase [Pelotomaculum terephthalicicum JT]OPX85617.1 MAG: UDP-N-acetylmuramoyl-L-alanyl-D-glutamate--LD-lysine ligase [Pelotomaculum sp. PtaB.Bin117]OPY64011.1 MAG: UDP-N-acetylmuramoyl-L-alanyl-D-glutamate--LD-lysine ligase [Pelotomaculum sp. PtaU1.Bin065]